MSKFTTRPTTRGATKSSRPGKSYFHWVRKFPLEAIHDEGQLDGATAVMHELLDKQRDAGEQKYFEALCVLIDAYEDEVDPSENVTPGEMLAFFMEEREISQTALARGAGVVQSTISSILNGTREPTLATVKAFSRFFKVSPALFIGALDKE